MPIQPNLLDDIIQSSPVFTPELRLIIENGNHIIKPSAPPLITLLKQSRDKEGNTRTIEQNMRLGKWLKQACPEMADDRIKYLVESYIKSNAVLSSYRIELTTDYEGIYSIPLYYMESEGQSCMTGNESVKVYNHDDRLKLWTVYNAENKLCGRSLIRLDKMQYIRLYIDKNLINPLNLLALIEREYGKGDLDGITLSYIEDGNGSFYCPYLDGKADRVDFEADYLRISTHGTYSGNTSGLIEIDSCHCSYCDTPVDVDDCYHDPEGDVCCPDCYHDRFCYCEYEDSEEAIDACVYISSDNFPQLARQHGEGYYTIDWLRDNMTDYL